MAIITPADRVEAFTVTAPALTLPQSAIEVATPYNPGDLVGIEIIIPDGHFGLTGIALGPGHGHLIPETAGSFIVSNDEKIEWPVEGLPNTGAWAAFVYNQDVLDHNFYVRYLLRELVRAVEPSAAVGLTPLPL